MKQPFYEIEIEELCRTYITLAKRRKDYSVEMLVSELSPQIVGIVDRELRRFDDRWAESDRILNREAGYEEDRLRGEVEYWKDKSYELGRYNR